MFLNDKLNLKSAKSRKILRNYYESRREKIVFMSSAFWLNIYMESFFVEMS